MALSKSTITGRVPLPTDENLQFAELTFALSGLDTEGASVLPGGVSTRAVLVGSDIPAGFELWQNTAGLRGTHYRVLARWTVKDRDGVREQYADLGVIQIGSDPSYTLADLINNGVPPAIGTFWSAITQAQYDAVIQAAADALASAVAAALYDGPRFGTIALMQAGTGFADGKFIRVDQAANGEQEGFVYDAASTLTADGALIVAATGMGVGRLISTRTVYATVAEMLADNRTLPDGTSVIVDGLRYVSVSSGAMISNAGGQGFVVLAAARARRDFVVTPQHFATDAQIATDADAAMLAAVNAAVSSPGGKVVLPKGLYPISPGLNLLRDGLVLEGEGRHFSQIVAKYGAGGDILSRAWNGAGANLYNSNLVLRDFAIILQHPATAAPGNYKQVGINSRHITRSQFERLYIGNFPVGLSKSIIGTPSHANSRQGYGVSGGTTSAGDVAYSGGEVNTYREIMVVGAQKGLVTDDPAFFNPGYSSASYINLFDHCEAQIVEMGFGQLSQYGAGNTYSSCIVQAVGRATGSTETTYEMCLLGYDHTIIGGYSENVTPDYSLYLGPLSKRNRAYYKITNATVAPTDLGAWNVIEYGDRTTNTRVFSVNKKNIAQAQAQAFVTWSVAAGVVTVTESFGVAGVIRNGTGDYSVNFVAGTFANGNYSYNLSAATNASGQGCFVYPRTPAGIGANTIRVMSYNITTAGVYDCEKYSAVFFGGQ